MKSTTDLVEKVRLQRLMAKINEQAGKVAIETAGMKAQARHLVNKTA
jgi:hypothetical protein